MLDDKRRKQLQAWLMIAFAATFKDPTISRDWSASLDPEEREYVTALVNELFATLKDAPPPSTPAMARIVELFVVDHYRRKDFAE